MKNQLNLKSYLKFLSKHKVYTFIEIFGLSVSFMFVIPIATYTVQELSIDKNQTKTANVYVLGSEHGFGAAYKIADRLTERFPGQILVKLTTTFINSVVIAFILAIPFIWYMMQDWLSGYSYRISLHPMIFMAAGATCLLISFLTVFWQSYQAATLNPAESIKAE